MVEAVSTSETSVDFYETHDATFEKTVNFISAAMRS
jgi:hypothetical protein